MELAFEYLLSKENLQWITIYSDQVLIVTPLMGQSPTKAEHHPYSK
jgi:hypothetical protein